MHDGSAILTTAYQAVHSMPRHVWRGLPATRDDIAQEVAMTLLGKPSADVNLACRIAQRRIADLWRQTARSRRRRPDVFYRRPLDTVTPEHSSIEARDWWSTASRRLSRCDRLLLLLTARGWSQRDIAALAGITQVGVLKRLRRIRATKVHSNTDV